MKPFLHPFELRRAASVEEAAALLAAEPAARLLAGGTDLLPNLRHGLGQPSVLIDLGGIVGFDAFASEGGALRIGAGTTLARIAGDAGIAARFPALAQAAEAVAGPTHRNVATLGGNLLLDTRCVYYNQSAWWRAANGYCLKRDGSVCHVAPQGKRCHAAYCGDIAPALLVLGAEAELVGPQVRRRVPLAELYREDGAAHLAVERTEVLAAVHLPEAALRSAYRKARVRGAIDFPLAGVAAAISVRNGVFERLHVALTGTNSRPLRLAGTDALLGRRADDGMLAALSKLVQQQASPMRTTATASHYRRQVAAVMARRLVAELAQAA